MEPEEVIAHEGEMGTDETAADAEPAVEMPAHSDEGADVVAPEEEAAA